MRNRCFSSLIGSNPVAKKALRAPRRLLKSKSFKISSKAKKRPKEDLSMPAFVPWLNVTSHLTNFYETSKQRTSRSGQTLWMRLKTSRKICFFRSRQSSVEMKWSCLRSLDAEKTWNNSGSSNKNTMKNTKIQVKTLKTKGWVRSKMMKSLST